MRDVKAVAVRHDLSPEQIRELLDFFGESSKATSVADLLDAPFKPKPYLNPPNSFATLTRFSDGSWPIFYSALEQNTSGLEVFHHYRRYVGPEGRTHSLHYQAFACSFEGSTIDLRSAVAKWPDLIAEETNNATCQDIGREAHNAGVSALLCRSVRSPTGTTVPVFARASLSEVELGFVFRFTLADGGDFFLERVPTPS
jgi:hypothetical protein